MRQLTDIYVPDRDTEILLPERDGRSLPNALTCLCCQRKRSPADVDGDGCGICDECLAP